MKTVVLDPIPVEVELLIEARRAKGLDLYDEIWEGTYHMSPAPRPRHAYLDTELAVLLHRYARAAGLIPSGPFNLGRLKDFRVPDLGLHRKLTNDVYLPTAAMVVEILSPGDESYQKLPFYATHASTRCSSWIRRPSESTSTV